MTSTPCSWSCFAVVPPTDHWWRTPTSCSADDRPGARELGVRATNLGITDWSVWSGGAGRSLVEEMEHPTQRCTIVDTGSLGSLQEQRLVSQAVLAALWRARAAHTPTLVVVDEAHNVCPAAADDPLTRLAAETTVQIAAEGRKYGLYLLLSTQQPHKVHPDVVAQCDNLLLMRMNSQADLADLERFFSFVPPGLVEGALVVPPGAGPGRRQAGVAPGVRRRGGAPHPRGRRGPPADLGRAATPPDPLRST